MTEQTESCQCGPIKGCGHFTLEGCTHLDALYQSRYEGWLESYNDTIARLERLKLDLESIGGSAHEGVTSSIRLLQRMHKADQGEA